MTSRRKPTPSYLHHKQSGRARAVWTDVSGTRRQKLLPGAFGSPESRTAFARLQLELATGQAAAFTPSAPAPSVNEILLAFLKHAEGYYRTPDGAPTNEVVEIRRSLAPVRELYGLTPAAEFGPKRLDAVRQHMIGVDLCRTLINRRVERVKRAFRWAASQELVPVAVDQALRTLSALKKGRTTARESEPVRPVPLGHVIATLPHLGRQLCTMIELERLTGMRPGEVCRLQFADIDRTGPVWEYRPEQHKSAHRGRKRTIWFGPQVQALLIGFLCRDGAPPEAIPPLESLDPGARSALAGVYRRAGRERDAALLHDPSRAVTLVGGCVVDPAAPVFSPAESRAEWARAARASRKSKVPPSQQNRRVAAPKRAPGARYTVAAYGYAVRKAAKKAGVSNWHPNQLRHLFATEVSREYGVVAAQVLLGHARADVTQLYAERDEKLAARIAAKIA